MHRTYISIFRIYCFNYPDEFAIRMPGLVISWIKKNESWEKICQGKLQLTG